MKIGQKVYGVSVIRIKDAPSWAKKYSNVLFCGTVVSFDEDVVAIYLSHADCGSDDKAHWDVIPLKERAIPQMIFVQNYNCNRYVDQKLDHIRLFGIEFMRDKYVKELETIQNPPKPASKSKKKSKAK